jgi:hypothetical protein
MMCLLLFAAGAVCAESAEDGDSPAPLADQAAADYQDFSKGQRMGTWALNNFVFPGLGSYLIMHDVLGGTIQLAAGGAGVGLTIAGAVFIVGRLFGFAFADQWGGEGSLKKSLYPYIGMIVAGGVLSIGNFIFNIARSVAYKKPQPRIGSLADPGAWSVAVLPGENGAEQVQLAYTMRL